MNHNKHHLRKRRVDQFRCTHCCFTSVDAEGLRPHVTSHFLDGATSFHSPPLSVQQLRERNLLFNPFSQIFLSPPQPTIGTSRSNRRQKQKRPQGSKAGRIPNIQPQIIQAAQEMPRPESKETAEASTKPLINQLDRPIPKIIHLDDDDDNPVDLTLRL